MADGTPGVVAVRSGGLTPSDPGATAELLSFNAYVRRAGGWIVVCPFRQGVALSETETIHFLEGRLVTLERVGVCVLPRGLASSETELICFPEGRLVTLERGGVSVLPRG